MEAPPCTPAPQREVPSTPRLPRGSHKCWTGAPAWLDSSTSSSETPLFVGSGSLGELFPAPHPSIQTAPSATRTTGPGVCSLQPQATLPLVNACAPWCRPTCPAQAHRHVPSHQGLPCTHHRHPHTEGHTWAQPGLGHHRAATLTHHCAILDAMQADRAWCPHTHRVHLPSPDRFTARGSSLGC